MKDLRFNDLTATPQHWDSQVALVVQNPPAKARHVTDMDSILGLGRFPGGGLNNPLQYSCLENLMDQGPWWATVHKVAQNQT